MKSPPVVACVVWFFVLLAVGVGGAADQTGAINGRISPKDASIRIIAKTAGTEHRIKRNIKGEVTLAKGGDFTIKGLPPGKYDLLFFLQGKSKKRYTATRWSEVVVQAGQTTSGINYRLTPRGSERLIDEVLVAFNKDISAADALKTICLSGCSIKDKPLKLDGTTIYTIDIPDNKSVAEMVKMFKQKRGIAYAEPNGIVTLDTR